MTINITDYPSPSSGIHYVGLILLLVFFAIAEYCHILIWKQITPKSYDIERLKITWNIYLILTGMILILLVLLFLLKCNNTFYWSYVDILEEVLDYSLYSLPFVIILFTELAIKDFIIKKPEAVSSDS